MKKIFKICEQRELEQINKTSFFKGSKNDKIDGFIHFSTADQIRGTLERHFKQKNRLYLLEVRTENLNIVWEKSRDNSYFPHLYQPLPIVEISRVYQILIGDDGKHNIPQHIFNEES